jgi:hypothetical protein
MNKEKDVSEFLLFKDTPNLVYKNDFTTPLFFFLEALDVIA